jgi:very-short-patch-repair endonuclease
MEVPISTQMPRGSGYPTAYKIDVGNTELKIAIEVDGFSHNALKRRAQDIKKAAFLESRGWRVLRFTNSEVRVDLTRCVQTVLSTISRPPEPTPTRPTE